MTERPNNPICGPPATRQRPQRLRPPHRPPCLTTIPPILVSLLLTGFVPLPASDWVRFVDETASRLVAAPDVGASDVAEKSLAWGDLDRDGDVDLVVARKQPFTTPGKRRSVLLINEAGVLVDRTADFATASDVAGDSGFFTPTNNRDIVLADVDLDGWLDAVTAVTLSDTDPQHIAYPRVYVNRGCAVGGTSAVSCTTNDWLGLRYESNRIPTMLSDSGAAGFNPRFNAVAVGDVSADGHADLYFSDHDGSAEPVGADFNDKLLHNKGPIQPGYFLDVTAGAFPGLVPLPGPDQPFPVSSFSTSAAIADMNGDGARDIVKHSGHSPPIYVGIAYNVGQSFPIYDVVYQNAPAFISADDLNKDDRVDLIITDDGGDRYLLNQGNDTEGLAVFSSFPFSFLHDGDGPPSSDQGFGGDSRIADLDQDGWKDVLVTDVEMDIAGCGRRLSVYHNLGGAPGANVTLREETAGTGCASAQGNPPSCLVAGIPASQLEGVHDVAVFDVDGDGWNDMVLGRCTGLAVYMNQPPVPAGGVPDGTGGTSPPLLLDKESSVEITLTWSPSCASGDADYEVYQGPLGHFASHTAKLCSTGGSTSTTIQVVGNAYFLVVPSSGTREGSYGLESDGSPRPPSAAPCLTQEIADCE